MFYILTPENKKDVGNVLKTSSNVSVLYYWNMCGYCSALRPTWDRVCNKYKNNSDCDIIDVEVLHVNHLPAKYRKDAKGYPTIIKYNKGKKVAEFSDERVFKKLDKFVKGKEI